jgi:hypothetical protein
VLCTTRAVVSTETVWLIKRRLLSASCRKLVAIKLHFALQPGCALSLVVLQRSSCITLFACGLQAEQVWVGVCGGFEKGMLPWCVCERITVLCSKCTEAVCAEPEMWLLPMRVWWELYAAQCMHHASLHFLLSNRLAFCVASFAWLCA